MKNRRQHTTPRFYLNRFLSPGWVYRLGETTPRFVKHTKNIAVRKDYYGCPDDERKALEEINRLFEREGAPALNRLINDAQSLTYSDWTILSYTFANFLVRNPVFLEEMRASYSSLTKQLNEMAEKMVEAYKQAEKEGKDLSIFNEPVWDDSPRASIDEWNKWAEELRAKNGHLTLATDTFGVLKDIAECIQKMSYYIFEAPQSLFFVTCDRPLILQRLGTGSPVGAGWGNADALATIPLSPRYLLLMLYNTPRAIFSKTISAEDIHFWNVNTMRFADTEVYSAREYDEAKHWMCRTGLWCRSS